MLWTIVGILLVLWILGMLTSTTIGGFIHVLIVIAVIIVVVNLFRGKKSGTAKTSDAKKT